jgi:hypothetical protein
MEVATRKGNPNFGKKKEDKKESFDPSKLYLFKLMNSNETAKPRDDKSGEILDNPYPPVRFLSSEGLANDPETGRPRRWRYVQGFPIWLDEQISPNLEPSKSQIESESNLLQFDKGFLKIQGDEAKLHALLLNNKYEGNDNPYRNVPKEFTLVDADEELFKLEADIDSAYEAMKFANEATIDDIIPVAMALGINVDDSHEKIKAQFKIKAKTMPEAFMKQVLNPRNEIKAVIAKALKKNIIEGKDNQIVMVDTGVVILEIDTKKDIVEELATLVLLEDNRAKKLYEQLKRQ